MDIMTPVIQPQLTLEEFLKFPETKPASEFFQGKIIQKSMPQGEHSRLQGKLCAVINQIAETSKIAMLSQSYAVLLGEYLLFQMLLYLDGKEFLYCHREELLIDLKFILTGQLKSFLLNKAKLKF